MRKILLALSIAFIAVSGTQARTLNWQEALNRAVGELHDTRSALQATLIKTVATEQGNPALYIMNRGNNGGFLVLSADDLTPAILAYSPEGAIDCDNISPAMQDWLRQYASQVEWTRSHSDEFVSPGVRAELPDWDPIEPLLTTKWDQDSPYFLQCPKSHGRPTYTGCVATSMAQVMNYFKYPEKGQGTHSFFCETLFTELSMDFTELSFDWEHMRDSYLNETYSQEEAEAVATLMVAAGHAVNMQYYTTMSGTQSGFISGGLVKYFQYDPGIEYMARFRKSYQEWSTMLYENLRDIGPVIYDGNTDFSGGHSFVLDGYAGEGYFHFNWGWSGQGDGYFLLDAQNPGVTGIGATETGFYFDQDAVFGIRPPQNDTVPSVPYILQNGSTSAKIIDREEGQFLDMEITGNPISGYRYFGQDEMWFDIGLGIAETENPDSEMRYVVCQNNEAFRYRFMPLDAAYYIFCTGGIFYSYPRYLLEDLALEEGVRYRIVSSYRPDEGEWKPVETAIGDFNYFYITRRGDQYLIENQEQLHLECERLKIDTELYPGKAAEVEITLTNPNEVELNRGVTLVLINAAKEEIEYIGESFKVTLLPGETKDLAFTSALIRLDDGRLWKPTEYLIGLYDLETDVLYYLNEDTVTMGPTPPAEDTAVESLMADTCGISCVYDKNTGVAELKCATGLRSVEVYSLGGIILHSDNGLHTDTMMLNLGQYGKGIVTIVAVAGDNRQVSFKIAI